MKKVFCADKRGADLHGAGQDGSSWLMDLALLVDITQELNELNLKLQGPGQLVDAAFENVKAFSIKLMLWKSPAV